MKINRVCILGGTGFVGRHLTAKLVAEGKQVRVLTRHPHRHREMRVPFGCELVEANIFDPKDLQARLQGCDAVINLVGILNQSRRDGFRRVHVELVDLVTDACRKARVPRLLHMSALQADETSGPSLYLRTKGAGENRAHTGGKPDIAVTSFRPSVIFGADDSFINRFAALLLIPGPMPLACPNSRFAPVYVGDVATAFANSLDDRDTFGKRYELCGPREFRLIDIVRYIARHKGRRKFILPLGKGISRLQASLLQFVPGKPFTPDNYRSLQLPSVCSQNGFAELGITPTDMDAVVPAFLGAHGERQRYNRLRQVSGNR